MKVFVKVFTQTKDAVFLFSVTFYIFSRSSTTYQNTEETQPSYGKLLLSFPPQWWSTQPERPLYKLCPTIIKRRPLWWQVLHCSLQRPPPHHHRARPHLHPHHPQHIHLQAGWQSQEKVRCEAFDGKANRICMHCSNRKELTFLTSPEGNDSRGHF